MVSKYKSQWQCWQLNLRWMLVLGEIEPVEAIASVASMRYQPCTVMSTFPSQSFCKVSSYIYIVHTQSASNTVIVLFFTWISPNRNTQCVCTSGPSSSNVQFFEPTWEFLRISHASLDTEEYTKEKEVSMRRKCAALPQEARWGCFWLSGLGG